MNHQIVHFFILIPLLLIAESKQITAQGFEQGVRQLEEKLDSITAVYNIPSIGYSVVNSDGVLKSGAVGLANVEAGLPAGSQTVYRVGSVTKSFIALGILRLVEENKLSLDDPYRIELLKIVNELLKPMRIYLEGDTLRLSNLTGFSKAISHEGDNYFRAADEPIPSLWLGKYDDKTVISSSHRGIGWYYERRGFLQIMWKSILFFVSFLWIILALLVSVSIYVYKLIRRQERIHLHTGSYLYQIVAGVLLMITLFLAMQLQDLHVIATMNATTTLLAMSSGLMPFMILLGLISIFKNSGSSTIWSRVFLYGTYGAWIIFLVILFSYGLIPLVTWMR